MKNLNKMTNLALSAVVLGAAVTALSVPTTVNAANTSNTANCQVKTTGKVNTAGNSDSRFTLNGKMVSAEFEVKGDATCKVDITLASWQAPNADKGRPYSEQKLYKYVTGNFGVGTHTLSVELPDCFYQVDLVRGKNPTGPGNSPIYEAGRMMGSLHGGTEKCEEPKKPVEKTPVNTPKEEVKSEVIPKVLPSTGIETAIGGLLSTSALAASLQYYRQSRTRR